MNTRVVSAEVPKPLAEQIDAIAARLDRSSDWIVRQALTDWVRQHDDRYTSTLEALAEVDSGAVQDHRMVEEWAANLDAQKT